MCKIINFPSNKIQNTNGYKNLVAIFEVCDSVESCNFYLESVENLYSDGNITEKEMYTLRRIGRQKRIELANPKQEAQEVNGAGTYCYTPEMGEQKPDCQIEAQMSYYGASHWRLKTALELKGRGIKKDNYNYGDNLNRYTVTKLAYEKLQKLYTISYKCALD